MKDDYKHKNKMLTQPRGKTKLTAHPTQSLNFKDHKKVTRKF